MSCEVNRIASFCRKVIQEGQQASLLHNRVVQEVHHSTVDGRGVVRCDDLLEANAALVIYVDQGAGQRVGELHTHLEAGVLLFRLVVRQAIGRYQGEQRGGGDDPVVVLTEQALEGFASEAENWLIDVVTHVIFSAPLCGTLVSKTCHYCTEWQRTASGCYEKPTSAESKLSVTVAALASPDRKSVASRRSSPNHSTESFPGMFLPHHMYSVPDALPAVKPLYRVTEAGVGLVLIARTWRSRIYG